MNMLGEAIKECVNCVECSVRIPFFNLLGPEELKMINKNRYSVRFRAGELIQKQGLTSTHVISLIKGFAKMYIEGFHGKNLLFKLLGPWQLIDESNVYAHEVNQFSVSALTDVQVCFIEVENFKKAMQANSDFACAVIQHRSSHSNYFYQRLVSLTQKQMMGRMADGLLYLANDFYQSDHFELNLSRQDLADLTSMSKDSAIRILKEFERDNVIDLKGRIMTIRDIILLKKISSMG